MLTRLSRREQVLLAVLLLVVAGFFGYKYIFVPQYNQFAGTAAQLDQARRQLQQARVTAASLQVEDRRLQAARSRYNRVGERFAAELRDGGAVVDIGLRAIASGVQITRWQAMNVIAEPYFLELPVNMELRGPYQGVLSFVDSLENRKAVPNLVSIRKLTLEAPKENQGSSGQTAGTGITPPAGGAGAPGISARLSLVFYSLPTPAGRLALDQVAAWKAGRTDPYKEPDLVSPYQGVTPRGLPPGVTANGGAAAGAANAAGGPTGTGYPGWFPWPGFPGPPPGASPSASGASAGGSAPAQNGQSPAQSGQPAAQKTGQPAAPGSTGTPSGQAAGGALKTPGASGAGQH